MTSPIDIRPQDLATVRLYLERTLPPAAKVYVFGSRANWTTKNGSDLDLAVDAGSPLPQRTMVELADAFEESDLPYKVDVVDLQTVAPDFGARIRTAMVPFPSGRAMNSTVDTWRRCKLGEILELKRGYDLPTADRRPGRIPLVSSSGVSDHIAEAKVPGPGVVTGRYGTIGEVYYLDEPFWPLNTTLYVRNFKGNDPRFISYLLKTLDFRAYSDKAAVPGLNRNHLHEAVVELPTDVEEQKAIAAILGAFDDKIELNRRMNETLEQTVRAIFKDWFVDFGPTRAKMEGRAPYLVPEIWSLFPERFGDEFAPYGWPIKRWGEIATLEYGKSLQNYKTDEGSFPVFGTNGRIGWHHTPLCNQPGTVIGRKGAYRGVHFSTTPFFVIDTAFYLKPREYCSARWIFYSALRIDINSMDSGSAIPSTSRDDFYNLQIAVPPIPIQDKFDEILSPVWLRQQMNESENKALAATRDLLLPKLMSGEIRVRDAEKIVGEVA